MRSKFSVISDGVFVFICTAFLSAVVYATFIPFPLDLIPSVFTGLAFGLITYLLLNKKRNSAGIKAKEKEEYENFIFQLCLMPKTTQNEFFSSYEKSRGFKVERKKGGVFLTEKEEFVFPLFSFAEVTKADIVKAFNAITKNSSAVILAEKFSLEVTEFAKKFGGKIILKNGAEVYAKLKAADNLPPTLFNFSPTKKKRHDFSLLLKKKKAKNFLAFGIFFSVMSFFVPIKLYYTICGCVFLAFALFLVLFGKKDLPAESA